MNPPLCSQSLEACEVKLPALVHLSETSKPETSSEFLQLESEHGSAPVRAWRLETIQFGCSWWPCLLPFAEKWALVRDWSQHVMTG